MKGCSHASQLETLRRHISGLEHPKRNHTPITPDVNWLLGVKSLDRALPADGLSCGAVHEASGATGPDTPSASAFLVALLRRLPKRFGRDTVLVCENDASRFGRLHGPGWHGLGINPETLLIARARHDKDVLWAMEEGLRCGALSAVLGEIECSTFSISRRLSLAATEGMTPALLLRHDAFVSASTAATRWRVAAGPCSDDPHDARAPGAPRWILELIRSRGGRPAHHVVEWHRETGAFRMAATLANRTP